MIELFEDIVEEFGTPVFVYFEDILRKRIEKVFWVFEGMNASPTFALKANNNPALLKIMFDSGFGADVVTPGELLASLKAGVDPEKVVWNGNGKTKDQRDFMLRMGVRIINVDSVEEFEELWREETGLKLFLRINPGVDAKTHEHISTGMEEHKFGVHVDKAREFLKENSGKFTGLHVHVGSQITDAGIFERAYEKILELSKEFGFREVNIGGGWGIDYGDGEELDLIEYRKTVRKLFSDFEKVHLELGRYVIAPAGSLVSRVIRVKKGKTKYFVVLDTGMSHLIRPPLYGAVHRVEFSRKTNVKRRYDVVGFLCETGDFILRDVEGEIPEVGSLAVIKDVGAYGYSMSSNYNSVPRPSEVLIKSDGNFKLIRERETLEDILSKVIL